MHFSLYRPGNIKVQRNLMTNIQISYNLDGLQRTFFFPENAFFLNGLGINNAEA